MQQKEYIYYSTQLSKYNSSPSDGFSIQDMPVASAIMTPRDADVVVHAGTIPMTGWAYSGGGHWPVRVELSLDGGAVWHEVPHEGLSPKRFHAWRTWAYDLPVATEGWIEVCVRAWDDACNTQPTLTRSAWNWDLHVTSSAHRIKVFSVNRRNPATARRLAAMEAAGESVLPLTRPLGIEAQTDEEYYAEVARKGGRDPEG